MGARYPSHRHVASTYQESPVPGASFSCTTALACSQFCIYLPCLIRAHAEPKQGTEHQGVPGEHLPHMKPPFQLTSSQSTLDRGTGRSALSFPMAVTAQRPPEAVFSGSAGSDISLGGSLFPCVSLTAVETLYKDQLFSAG